MKDFEHSIMVESEEFLQEIHSQLSASDKHVDKEALRNYLLVPGEERLQLICWALSEMNIVIKNHDVKQVVIDCGLCLPSNPDIVLGKCSTKDNFAFWKRLFHTLKMYQEAKPTMSSSRYDSICKFWLELSADPALKDILQLGKKRDILPLKVPENSGTNKSVEQLLKEKVLEEHKLREMQKEEEAYQPTYEGEHCNTGAQDTELDKLKEQVNIFKNDVANSFMPWILDVPKNSEFDEYNKAIPKLASKVETIKAICEDTGKIVTALETLSNIKFKEPSVDVTTCLPYIQKD